jgi:hypothetical protein
LSRRRETVFRTANSAYHDRVQLAGKRFAPRWPVETPAPAPADLLNTFLKRILRSIVRQIARSFAPRPDNHALAPSGTRPATLRPGPAGRRMLEQQIELPLE